MCVDPRISRPAIFHPFAGGGHDEQRRAERSPASTRPTTSTMRAASRSSRGSTRQPLHETVRRALEALENLEHRGAAGADPGTGDGAGILMQIPDAFFRAVVGDALPAPGRYGVAMCFLPAEPGRRQELEARLAAIVEEEGQGVVCWRDVPVDPALRRPHRRSVGPGRPAARRRGRSTQVATTRTRSSASST